MEKRKTKKNPMDRIATFIVDKRNLFFLLYIAAIIFSFVSSSWVKVNDDISSYLPEETETRMGKTIMDEDFITYGTNRVMISNITYDKAEALADDMEAVDGVQSVDFDDTEDHYRGTNALYSVTYEGEAEDEVSLQALEEIRGLLAEYDVSVDGEVGNDSSELLNQEIQVILAIAAVVILLVVTLTSKTFAEVPVLVMTFLAAILLNKGTNFLFGEISFVSNSVCAILQLALSIDYAIILVHRFSEERAHSAPREACITALSKAIIEISSSSLTTVSGLAAMMFMQFEIGFDLGRVLIKAVLCTMLSVFTLMPGLLMLFSNAIDKTHHRNFLPQIDGWGRLITRIYPVLLAIFAVFLVGGAYLSNQCPYAFDQYSTSTISKSEAQLERERIEEAFGKTNALAVLVPAGDYESEKKLLQDLEQFDEIDQAVGLSNTEVDMDDDDEEDTDGRLLVTETEDEDVTMLTDSLTPRQFAELTDLDIEAVRLIYAAYALDDEDYGSIINNLDAYEVPLIDMFLFAYDHKDYVDLDEDQEEDLDDLYETLTNAQDQLQSEDYTRMVLTLNLPTEDDETFAFLETIRDTADKYYQKDSIYLVGDSTTAHDLSSSFSRDNAMIGVLSAVFVVVVLLFTFQSVGLSILLIIVIQGSIWINFSVPTLTNTPLFFMGYLIVSSIQMGANIDYAIVVANRYQELKTQYPLKKAMIMTLSQAFPTIITSGTIMSVAGFLIQMITTSPVIYGIGECICRGTLISMFLVMAVLPGILLVGDTLMEKSRFNMRHPALTKELSGRVRVDGHVRGYVCGQIDAEVHGVIQGEIDASVDIRQIQQLDSNEQREQAEQNENEQTEQSDTAWQPDDVEQPNAAESGKKAERDSNEPSENGQADRKEAEEDA